MANFIKDGKNRRRKSDNTPYAPETAERCKRQYTDKRADKNKHRSKLFNIKEVKSKYAKNKRLRVEKTKMKLQRNFIVYCNLIIVYNTYSFYILF